MNKYYKVPNLNFQLRELIWVYPECSYSKPSWVHSDSGHLHSESSMELTEILDLGAEEVFPSWAKIADTNESAALLDMHENMTRQHHTSCYNKTKFKWTWCTIDHVGIWAFGGFKDAPSFTDAAFRVPVSHDEKKPGWYCYIGPEPEFETQGVI
jgi:hypothetical protein